MTYRVQIIDFPNWFNNNNNDNKNGSLFITKAIYIAEDYSLRN